MQCRRQGVLGEKRIRVAIVVSEDSATEQNAKDRWVSAAVVITNSILSLVILFELYEYSKCIYRSLRITNFLVFLLHYPSRCLGFRRRLTHSATNSMLSPRNSVACRDSSHKKYHAEDADARSIKEMHLIGFLCHALRRQRCLDYLLIFGTTLSSQKCSYCPLLN